MTPDQLQIVRQVAIDHGVKASQILGHMRLMKVAKARWDAFARMKARGMGVSDIARAFGMDCTSVRYGISRHGGLPAVLSEKNRPRYKSSAERATAHARMIVEYWKAQGVEVAVEVIDGRIVSRGIPLTGAP